MAVSVEQTDITQLSEIVLSLSEESQERFNTIFELSTTETELNPGALVLSEEIRRQKLVRVRNRWDHKQVKFNSIRASRPQQYNALDPTLDEIEERRGKDDFCNWQTRTPQNVFGRAEGGFCVTAASIAQSATHHAILVFKEHTPLIFPNQEQFLNYLDVAYEWFLKAHDFDPTAVYPTFLWNKSFKGGASVWYHGHGQLYLERGFHEGVMDEYLDVSDFYHRRNGRDYFQDWFLAHQAIGLGIEKEGVKIFPSLTAVKERQIIMFAPEFNRSAQGMAYRALRYFVEDMGVKAFNFCIMHPPLNSNIRSNGRSWEGIPVVISMLDRGDPRIVHSDMGTSETLVETSIVAADPFWVQAGLKVALAA